MDMAKRLFFSQRTLAAIFSTANKLQMQGDKYLQDITLRQMLAIPTLFHAPGGKATINYIAQQLGTSKQSAKQIVDAMQKKDYVSVTPSKRDKRAVDVTITQTGKQAFGVCSERTDIFLADIFRRFTTEEIEMLFTLLDKLFRFDDATQNSLGGPNYNPEDAEETLRHHPEFLKNQTPCV